MPRDDQKLRQAALAAYAKTEEPEKTLINQQKKALLSKPTEGKTIRGLGDGGALEVLAALGRLLNEYAEKPVESNGKTPRPDGKGQTESYQRERGERRRGQ